MHFPFPMPQAQQTQIRFHVPGRLRIVLPSIKRNEAQARLVEQYLRDLEGVRAVHANPLTGSLLVRFDPRMTGVDRIVDALQVRGFVGPEITPPAAAGGVRAEVSVSRAEPLADALVGMALEAIVRRCARALIATLV